ncbi:hypothetical protein, partial [Escherichia coli]|uniref:hypothetical protein n=1 Tax=Escherichia coli TaxID=562 RepID=UPI0023AFBD9F
NSFWMVTLKAHILPHHDLQPPGCRGSWFASPGERLRRDVTTAHYVTTVRASFGNPFMRGKAIYIFM